LKFEGKLRYNVDFKEENVRENRNTGFLKRDFKEF